MKLRDLIKMLKRPDHLPRGMNVLDLEVEFYTDYFQPKAEILSVYASDDRTLCIDVAPQGKDRQ